MSTLELKAVDVDRLRSLTGVLIPGTSTMPDVSDLAAFEGLLRIAVAASAHAEATLRRAIDALPPALDWDTVESHAKSDPDEFRLVAELVSAAYYMDPLVLGALSYSVERRHPARLEEFAEEYESGVLDQMMERTPSFRDPRAAH